jgi:hypothetical protein
MAVSIKQSFLKLFPNTLDENQFSALSALVGRINSKTDIIKVEESQLPKLFGYGRDRTDQTLTALVEKKYITREQKRNDKGQFDYNEIRIITNLVS